MNQAQLSIHEGIDVSLRTVAKNIDTRALVVTENVRGVASADSLVEQIGRGIGGTVREYIFGGCGVAIVIKNVHLLILRRVSFVENVQS